MPNERPYQVWQLLCAAQGADSQQFDLAIEFDGLVTYTSLEIRPDLLIGVELGQIRWQQVQLTTMTVYVQQLQGGLVHRMKINHHEHRIDRTHLLLLQESLEDRADDTAVVQHEAELALRAHSREHVKQEDTAGRHHQGHLSRRYLLRRDGLLQRDTADQGQRLDLAKLAQDRQRRQTDQEAKVKRRIVGGGMGQRLYLNLGEHALSTWNRPSLEHQLPALLAIGQSTKVHTEKRAVEVRDSSRLHAGSVLFDGTQAHRCDA